MKKALITGASSGLGLEFVRQLKINHWDVYGIARTEEKLRAHFSQDHYLVADLSTESGIKKAELLIEDHDFELLINNAGYGFYTAFADGSIEKQMNMMHLNMDALVRLSYTFLRKAKKGDALLNISSALSLMPMPGSAVYSATKSFVTAFSECLWYEFRNKGVYILANLPGPVNTPFHEVAGGNTDSMDPKLILSPEKVVTEALKALDQRKKPSVVNGFPFKMITKYGQLMSRPWRLNTMAKNGPVKF